MQLPRVIFDAGGLGLQVQRSCINIPCGGRAWQGGHSSAGANPNLAWGMGQLYCPREEHGRNMDGSSD